MIRRILLLGLWAGAVLRGFAADGAPVFGPGATKDEIIEAYGWPTGQSQAGNKEILTYPQGRIILENGKVERMDFLPNVPWPAPRPRPSAVANPAAKKAEALAEFWLTDYAQAQKEAGRRNARIFAAFVGSDWSPPSRQFQTEVAYHPDFINTFTADFVFLLLDFPTRTPQPAELREQNNQLRVQHGVTTYPAFLILSPAGVLVGAVDLTKPRTGESYRARVIAAVREARDQLPALPPPDPAATKVAAPATEPLIAVPNVGSTSLSSAAPMVLGALGIGAVFVGLAWWILWRRPVGLPSLRVGSMADRISDAAEGVPTLGHMLDWDRKRLGSVVGALAAMDGYECTWLGGGADGDLALAPPGGGRPSIIVSLQTGSAGQAPGKRLRELLGTITAEDVAKGWFVSPAGFSQEALDFASAHPIVLFDASDLAGQMRALPPLLLRKVLSGK